MNLEIIFILILFKIFSLAENTEITCSIIYVVLHEWLTLVYTPLEREFKDLFSHV